MEEFAHRDHSPQRFLARPFEITQFLRFKCIKQSIRMLSEGLYAFLGGNQIWLARTTEK
jgi:hypothetical protein